MRERRVEIDVRLCRTFNGPHELVEPLHSIEPVGFSDARAVESARSTAIVSS
jgi:hypothetical protein